LTDCGAGAARAMELRPATRIRVAMRFMMVFSLVVRDAVAPVGAVMSGYGATFWFAYLQWRLANCASLG